MARSPLKAALRSALFLGVALALVLQVMPLGTLASHTAAHNNAPVINTVLNQTVLEGQTLHLEIFGSDADGDNVVFEVINLPSGAIFQQNTTYQAYFKWTPSYSQAGAYTFDVKLRDEYVADFEDVNITVVNVNRAPTMGFLHNKWIDEFEDFDMDIFASDPDGDTLVLTLESDHKEVLLPNAAIPFNSDFSDGGDGSGAFAWTPDCTQGNVNPTEYNFWANVTDGTLSFTRTFKIYVYDVNAPPAIDFIPITRANEGDSVLINITATSCDLAQNHFLDVGIVSVVQGGITPPALPTTMPNSTLSWLPDLNGGSANVVPEEPAPMLFDPIAQKYYSLFYWNITFQEAGNYTFYAQVTDALGEEDNTTFIIRVNDTNTAPELILPPFHNAAYEVYYGKEDTYFYTVSPLNSLGDIWTALALDGENDVVFWELDWLDVPGVQVPEGMTFITPDPPAPAAASFFVINWSLDYEDAGTYHFRLDLSDGAINDREFFNITVENTNRRPFIEPIAPEVIFENEQVIIHPSGFDLDFSDPVFPDDVEMLASGLPAGSQFQYGHDEGGDQFNGTFIWTPGYHQAGIYTVTLTAVDWDPTSELPDTPLDPLSDLEYINPPVVPVEPFEYNWTTAFTIQVLNVDRPPVCDDLVDQTWMVGTPITVPISCSDPDGDPIVLAATPLPAGATLTDNGDGTGSIDWTPAAGQSGVYDITVNATSGVPPLVDFEVVRIVVVDETDFEVSPVGPVIVSAAPGVPVMLIANVENTGPAGSDVISFTTGSTGGGATDVPAPVAVPAGGSALVVFNVTLPTTDSSFIVSLTGTSTIDPALVKTTKWRVDVPVGLVITMTNTLPGLVEGFVNATYADGTPVVGLDLTATQNPNDVPNPFGAFTSSVSGETDTSGVFFFSFAGDVPAGLPGEHRLIISGQYFGKQTTVQTTYTVP